MKSVPLPGFLSLAALLAHCTRRQQNFKTTMPGRRSHVLPIHMMEGVPDERDSERSGLPREPTSEVVRPSETPIGTRDIPHFALISPYTPISPHR